MEQIKIMQTAFGFTKDMNISDYIRAPFVLLSSIIKFIMKNIFSIIVVVVTIVIFYYLFKFFRWWKQERILEIEDENKSGRNEVKES